MIADRVIEYLKGPGSKIPETALETALHRIGDSLITNMGERQDSTRRIKRPRPSASWACGREMVLSSLGLGTEGYGWRSRMTFAAGDYNEAVGILLFRQALATTGEDHLILTPNAAGDQLELDATLDPAAWGVEGTPFRLTGHVDMTIRGLSGDEEPVDWKGVATYTWEQMMQAATKPDHEWWKKEASGYVAQVRWYQILLRAQGRSDARRGYLVGVNKNTGLLAEVAIDQDPDAERLLIQRAVWVREKIHAAWKKRGEVMGDGLFAPGGNWHDYADQVDEDGAIVKPGGTRETDEELSEWVRQNVPRASFAASIAVPRQNVKLPDGEKGDCLELDMKADPQAFRCSYCDHTARCWPGFEVVPLTKPVWRKAVAATSTTP